MEAVNKFTLKDEKSNLNLFTNTNIGLSRTQTANVYSENQITHYRAPLTFPKQDKLPPLTHGHFNSINQKSFSLRGQDSLQHCPTPPPSPPSHNLLFQLVLVELGSAVGSRGRGRCGYCVCQVEGWLLLIQLIAVKTQTITGKTHKERIYIIWL